MFHWIQVPFLALAIGAAAQTQPSAKHWADPAEYDLANRVFTGTSPDQQLALLQEWETRYPKTAFERQRLTSFVMALQSAGKFSESFTRANELLNLDPGDSGALLLIAMLGPKLPSASEDQIAIVVASANKLLSMPSTPTPHRRGASIPDPSPEPTPISDAETERVVSFVQRLRKDTVPPPQPPTPRQVAEAALEWAKSIRK